MNLGDNIRSRLVETITHNDKHITTIATVIKADEKNNVCDIKYVSKEGNMRIRKGITVRLYGSGTDWFPEVNDTVLIDESRDVCVIIARYVENYNMDVRSKMKLVQDVHSDSNGATPGGYCY